MAEKDHWNYKNTQGKIGFESHSKDNWTTESYQLLGNNWELEKGLEKLQKKN